MLFMAVILVGAIGLMWRLVPAIERSAVKGAVSTTPLPNGFVPLVVARFLFLFGVYGVGRFLLPLVAERLGLDVTTAADETGGLLALFTLVTVAAAFPAGALSDRVSGRLVMVAGTAISATGILLFVPPLGVVGIFLGGVMMSLGTGVFASANWAATTRLTSPERSGRLMGIANIGTGLAAACAGLLGPMIAVAGFAPALCLAALISAAAMVPLARLAFVTSPASMGQPA